MVHIIAYDELGEVEIGVLKPSYPKSVYFNQKPTFNLFKQTYTTFFFKIDYCQNFIVANQRKFM